MVSNDFEQKSNLGSCKDCAVTKMSLVSIAVFFPGVKILPKLLGFCFVFVFFYF